MRQNLNKFATLILKATLPVTIFLIPLFFLPITSDFFTLNKQVLLTIIASISLLAWCLRLITQKQLRLTLSPALLPLLGLSFIYLASSLFQNPNPLNDLFGRTNSIVALTIIFITTTSSLALPSNISLTFGALVASISLASLFTIYQFLGLSSIFSSVAWLQNKSFNIVGGPLPFLTLALPTLVASIYLIFKLDQPLKKLILLVASALTTIASILAISLLLPQDGQPQLILLPYSAGWIIAVDTFKTLRTALIGTGPESFVNVYSQLKPAFINNTFFWNLRFGNSSNEIFHLLTTVGLLGLATYLLATIRTLVRAFKQTKANPYLSASRLILLVALAIQFFFPASLPLITLTFISLALTTIGLKTASTNPVNDVNLSFFAAEIVKSKSDLDPAPKPRQNTEILPWIVLALSLTLILPTTYFKAKAYAAETVYFQSAQATAENRGIDTYNLQIRAIELNPYNPTLRISYSQTNMALANALASQENPSDEDRNNIIQLIQQAIREAKNATALDPNSPIAWQNLASVYRQLIGLADNAESWTVAAYTQAIALDPVNPQLRLDLGGVYFSLNNFEEAIRLFSQATEAKPDWANAYYNLAAAYTQAQAYPQALQAMRIVVSLLEPTSPDYQTAQDQLKELEKLAESAAPPAQEGEQLPPVEGEPAQQPELITPTPIPSPSIEPIQLPDGSGIDLPAEPETQPQPEEENPTEQPQEPTPTP